MNQGKKIAFVTGGTGFVGSYLIRLLVKKGYQVVGLKRSTSRMDLLGEVASQVQWITGDLFDLPALDKGVEQADVVFHCAAVVSFVPEERNEMMRTNIEGTANVVNSCLAFENKRLVYTSSISAIGRPEKSSHVYENTPWENSTVNSNYSISKHQAELEVWRGIAEGLSAVMVNPAVIIGGAYWNGGTARIFQQMERKIPFYPIGRTGFVDIRDVVSIMLELHEKGVENERFILTGANVKYKEFLDLVSEGIGVKKPPFAISTWLGELAWRLDWLRSKIMRDTPFITKETIRTARESYWFEAGKIEKALSYVFIPIEKTVKDTAEVYIASKQKKKDFGIIAI